MSKDKKRQSYQSSVSAQEDKPGMGAQEWPLAHADYSQSVRYLPPSLFSSKILSKTKIHFSFHGEVDKWVSAWAAV